MKQKILEYILLTSLLVFIFIFVVGILSYGVGFYIGYANGNSMSPKINDGDFAIVAPPRDIDEGDIIIFNVQNEYFITDEERIVHEIKENVTTNGDIQYITKGINNDKTDQEMGYPVIEPKHIEGKVIYRIQV